MKAIVFIIFLANATIVRAARDGLSERRPGIDWTKWHLLGWSTIDALRITITICAVVLGDWLFALAVLATGLLHQPVYRYTILHEHLFHGSPDAPHWFRVLQSLWSWLPGQAPVITTFDVAIARIQCDISFIAVLPAITESQSTAIVVACSQGTGSIDITHRSDRTTIHYTSSAMLTFEENLHNDL